MGGQFSIRAHTAGHTLITHTCLQTKAADFTLKLLECMVVRVYERLSCEQYSKSYLHLHICPIDLDGVCAQ